MNKGITVRISDLVVYGTLLVLGQLLITQWTVHAAGNRDVLDYVSFAGTVVGMILAVLAIVYSYLANASQKADAEALRAQIDILNQTINRADIAGREFESALVRLDDISRSIGAVSKLTEESLAVSRTIHERMHALEKVRRTASAEKVSKVPATTQQASQCLTVADLASKATQDQVISYFQAALDIEGPNGEFNELKSSLAFDGLNDRFVEAVSEAFKTGEIMSYFLILNWDFRLGSDKAARIEFYKALRQRIELINPKTGSIYKEESYAEKKEKMLAWLNERIPA